MFEMKLKPTNRRIFKLTYNISDLSVFCDKQANVKQIVVISEESFENCNNKIVKKQSEINHRAEC